MKKINGSWWIDRFDAPEWMRPHLARAERMFKDARELDRFSGEHIQAEALRTRAEKIYTALEAAYQAGAETIDETI